MKRLLSDKRLWIGGLVGLCIVVAALAAGFFAWQQLRPAGLSTTSDPNNDGVTSGTEIRVETGDNNNVTAGPDSVIAEGPVIGTSGTGRFSFRLSEGQAVPEEAVVLAVVGGEPLSPEDTQAVLDRLPPLETEAGDETGFNLPPDSLPPPQPGETIAEPFPAPQPPAGPGEEAADGPLEVLRFAPEGEIPIAPFLNVTFNQPMVPLGTVEQLAAADVPVTISPAIPGEWRWLGTTTLSFVYDGEAGDRFPMATEYLVEIPAGTTSQTGGVLAETVTWRFSTPPVQLENYYPTSDATPLETLIFAEFDQQIDPAAVLAATQVTAGGEPVNVQLAGAEEFAADETVQRLVERAQDGRWLVLRPAAPLPHDTAISVTFPPGTPSAEGPLNTTETQSFTFHTYGPLQIIDHTCGFYDEGECPPLTPFYIEFSNSLDMDAFDPEMIAIEPPLDGAVVRPQGRRLEIRGLTTGRTRYQVTVSSNIQDIFGQTMGSDETLTFRVGSASRTLIGPDRPFVTLDPAAPRPALSVYTVNFDELNVEVYAVEPGDWFAFRQYLDEYYRQENPPTPPGEKVMDTTIAVDAADDELAEVPVDLAGALDGDYGHLVVIVQPPAGLFENRFERPVVQTWVQVTDIGLDAVVDPLGMTAWTTNLADGAPLSGVTLELAPQGTTGNPITAVTGADGTATLSFSENSATYLLARQGEDTAMLLGNPYYYSEDFWQVRPQSDEIRWYVMDDRQLYQPGEEVHIKGWLRRVGGDPAGDVGLSPESNQVAYSVIDPQGNEIHAGEVAVSDLGGFDFQFSLPEESNLGYAEIMMVTGGSGDLAGKTYYHAFQVQEFRRPEFEVTARTETAGPYFVGDSATVATQAAYFAGGPLPNAEVNWHVSASPGSYNPPNWPDFIFGTWTPWWFGFGYYEEEFYAGDIAFEESFFPPEIDSGYEQTFTGVTDANGEHYLQIDFESLDTPQPFSLRAQATVFDVNRQAWSAATNLLVHPADLYVGLRSDTNFVRQGDPLEIAAIVTDIDGNAIPGREITIVAGATDWEFRDGRYQEVLIDEQTCTVTSTAEPVTCTFDTAAGGEYQITATVTDSQGRSNQSQFTRWVSGGKQPPAREVEQEEALLVPDKQTYYPGDTAEILVSAPWDNGEGLLTVSRSGILYQERFALNGGSATLAIPIQEAHLPNLNIQVDLVGAAPRTDDAGDTLDDAPARPAYASGYLTLEISTRSRELDIAVSPAVDALEPGGETTIDVLVTDATGAPVPNAELAVIVVDEAILALSNYDPADPLSVFYRNRGSNLSSYYGRETVVLARPDALLNTDLSIAQDDAFAADGLAVEESMEMESPADFDEAAAPLPTAAAVTGESSNRAAQNDPIQVRSDFNPLAAFVPVATTDGDGRASVPVELPDNLTRYRVLVVAVAGENQFGQGESNLTARLPLMVRPSAPRFLNFGDRFELPVVLQNQTGEPLTVDVVVAATNAIIADGANGVRVTVPANDRVEVRFPTETAGVGTARFQVGAVSGAYADAAAVELPVYTPATTEAFATYGVLDAGAVAQPILAPTNVFTQFGELEIQTSSTALQALTDAVIYLANYPYESAPHIASRVLAVAALRDVLSAFEAEGLPAEAELEAQIQADIERLVALQNPDGGWPAWSRFHESVPYYSVHVAHALVAAQEKGFSVPAGTLDQSRFYLQNIEDFYFDYYGAQARHALSAYALHVRRLMGDSDPLKAARILVEAGGIEGMPLEGLAWLWPVLGDDPANDTLVAEISQHFSNQAVETAGAANFITGYDDDDYLLLHSNRRTDGVILDALIEMDPESDLIPKVVTGLLANQERGRWDNTQENVFILLALDRYFNTFEAQTPDFVANIWLGDTYAGGHTYEGRTTERHETEVPLAYLAAEDPGQLILSKDGDGRLYYRLGLNYAPTDLQLEALDRGFVVERSYEAVDDPEDVRQNEDGSWTIRAGARVRVNITMVARSRRYHVALVDPLPAGLEIINPALAASQDIPADPNARSSWWYWTWYDHQNLRDHQAEAFSTLLWDGVYTYSYVARATTPGAFVVPPAKAEEMYAPETFGRSTSDLVIVE